MPRQKKTSDPFRWFDSSPEVIQLVVMLYVRFPLSLRNIEDLAFERGIDIRHETMRLWVNRFGPMFAAKMRAKRVSAGLALPSVILMLMFGQSRIFFAMARDGLPRPTTAPMMKLESFSCCWRRWSPISFAGVM